MPSVLRKTGNAAHRRIGAARPWRDTPFIEAHTQGFYDELRNALASMLHTSLKTSNDLQYAMLTGIQRVAKENTPKAGRSLFSDLNNLLRMHCEWQPLYAIFRIYWSRSQDSLTNLRYTIYTGIKANVGAARPWRDGYNMGGIDIYTASGQSLIHGQL